MIKTLTHLYGNKTGQRFLERISRKAHLYMGIGSGENVYESGEAGVLRRLKQLHTPPYCIFDVGSNQGQYLDLVLSTLVGEDFHIHCFEPSSTVFSVLTKCAHGDPRVTLNNIGLGRQKGDFDLFFESRESGGSLSHRQLDSFGISFSNTETVHIDTVDNYCAARGVEFIHLLKVDIEGHEMDLLLGAQRMFEKRAIGMTTFEFGGCNIDTRTYYKDFFYFFRQNGMHIYRITPTGYLHPLPEYREIDEQFRTTNFVTIDNRKRSPLPTASSGRLSGKARAFKRSLLPRQSWNRWLWMLRGKPMPPPSPMKQWIVAQYARKYGLETLIETGTYEGDMVEAMRGCFRTIHSIEIFEPLYWKAVEKFRRYDHIHLHYGDSENILPRILEQMTEPVLFWLDAHYSGKGTGKGNIGSPILRELKCIFDHPVKNHVILIDDSRLFGKEDGFPSLNEIREFVVANHPGAEIDLEADIIRIRKA